MGRCTEARTRLTSITWPDSRRRMRTTVSGVSGVASLPGKASESLEELWLSCVTVAAAVAGLPTWPCLAGAETGSSELETRNCCAGVEFQAQKLTRKLQQRLENQMDVTLLHVVLVSQQKVTILEHPKVACPVVKVHRPSASTFPSGRVRTTARIWRSSPSPASPGLSSR